MQQAMLALVLCDRCLTETRSGEQHCSECGAPIGSSTLGRPAWLTSTIGRGSVPAAPVRRALSAVISLVVWAIAVVGVVLGVLALGGSTAATVGIGTVAAVLLAVAVGAPWLARGRTVGDLLCRTRTVGVVSGTPLGIHGVRRAATRFRDRATADDLARHPNAQGPITRFLGAVTVSLAAGRDPRRLALQPLGSLGPVASSPPLSARSHSRSVSGALEAITLEFDGGAVFPLTGVAVVGRNPPAADGISVIAVPDLSRLLSKTHARVEWTGTAVVVTDLGSTNGTAFQAADGTLTELDPHVPTTLPIGAAIALADRSVTVHYREGVVV